MCLSVVFDWSAEISDYNTTNTLAPAVLSPAVCNRESRLKSAFH